MAPPKIALTERFWPKVNQTGSCWNWTGPIVATTGRGRAYVQLIDGKRKFGAAHRIAWELSNGPIPKGMVVCHRCDNPICCRPDHLFLGTQADNMADMVAKGRQRNGINPGEKNGSVKLTDEQVAQLRQDRVTGMTYSELGRRYGIGKSQVCRIVRGLNRI